MDKREHLNFLHNSGKSILSAVLKAGGLNNTCKMVLSSCSSSADSSGSVGNFGNASLLKEAHCESPSTPSMLCISNLCRSLGHIISY